MMGLEVPDKIVEALGDGKRPPVVITINGHTWKSRVAVMRGRNLLGLSIANRQAAGVETGDVVVVEIKLDTEPRVLAEHAELLRALEANPSAHTAYDRLSPSRKRAFIVSIEGAKRPETRANRIATTVAALEAAELASGTGHKRNK
jgi:hypothetical protein